MSGGRAHLSVHRFRFNDTDQLGHINNAVFAVMLEQGRAELMAEAGLPVGAGPHGVVIVRLELDFLAEMAWPGEARIETEIARLGGRSIRLHQRILSAETLCARADTVLVIMDREARRAVPIEPWRDRLAPWLAIPA